MGQHTALHEIASQDASIGASAIASRQIMPDTARVDAQIAGHVQAAIQPGVAIVRAATVVLTGARWSTGLGLIAGAATWQFLLQIGWAPVAHYAAATGATLVGACLGRPLDTYWRRFR